MAEGQGRPRALLLGPGDIADVAVAPDLPRPAPPRRACLGDQDHDARAPREQAARAGALAVIPDGPARRNPHPLDASRCGARDAIERADCRLTNLRRMATRRDRPNRSFASAGALVAAVT